MLKICLIQDVLKDSDFSNGGEKVNYQILKALSESDFVVDVFCIKNCLKNDLKLHHITELASENFYHNAVSIANRLNFDLTFATDYLPTDVVYLHQHTRAYRDEIVKNKFVALIEAIFARKQYKKALSETLRQERFAKEYKAILTPSTILKNDLINLLNVDGQNVYILPPSIDIPEHIKIRKQKCFSFGFYSKNFVDKGGIILLKALANLKRYEFKLKLHSDNAHNKLLMLYLKILKLQNKIEFIKEENIENFYDEIDCLILPSRRETFGLEALEAMSCGKIVVVSSRCGARDIIEPHNNGFIFDITKNPERNLSRVLQYILVNQDDFENLRQKAVYTASVYNFEKFKTELIRILQKFAQKNEAS